MELLEKAARTTGVRLRIMACDVRCLAQCSVNIVSVLDHHAWQAVREDID
jgi:hypothetical protein